MITVFFSNGTKMEFSMATEVRGNGFLQSDEPGVTLLDGRGNVLAEFKAEAISGYTDDVETTRRQKEVARATMPLRVDDRPRIA